jgi:hypothetical protein
MARATKAPVEGLKLDLCNTGVIIRCVVSHKVAYTFADVEVLNMAAILSTILTPECWLTCSGSDNKNVLRLLNSSAK